MSTEPTGRPGRYQRSAVSLVVSLIVTVAAIGALLYFMGIFRDDYESRPDKVDYLAAVASAEGAGLAPVYPSSIPKGWIATGVDVVPGDEPVFMVRFLTDDDRFVAVRREDSSASALASAWVDEDAKPAKGYTVPDDVRRPVARSWEGYADDGGDTGYVAEVGDDHVIVFGSAPAADLHTVIDRLTVGEAQSSPSSLASSS